jgi:hypothetical protein
MWACLGIPWLLGSFVVAEVTVSNANGQVNAISNAIGPVS